MIYDRSILHNKLLLLVHAHTYFLQFTRTIFDGNSGYCLGWGNSIHFKPLSCSYWRFNLAWPYLL